MSQAVVAGPFFVSDVYMTGYPLVLDTVQGNDCSVSSTQHVPVIQLYAPTTDGQLQNQRHGMRLPVLAGQTLCATPPVNSAATVTVTVLGFKPY